MWALSLNVGADVAIAYISIGSNIDRQRNIRGALHDLRTRYSQVDMSPIYENPAEGFTGEPFYNLVARIVTTEDIASIARSLADIENKHGRTRDTPRFSARTLDLDLLLYDDVVMTTPALTLPRKEIRKYAFVLKPLYDLAPDLILPDSGEALRAVWQAFPLERVQLVVVEV